VDDRGRGGPWAALGWMAFPLVPALLAMTYHRTVNVSGTDPRDWGWDQWLVLLGPLWGYGFLAGATAGLPDDPGLRGMRGLLSRRAARVAVGPWIGFLAWAALLYASVRLNQEIGPFPAPDAAIPDRWKPWVGQAMTWAFAATLAYGWVLVAIGPIRRARGLGLLRRTILRGLAAALAFVGSLIGGFWTATAVWRSYFFDPTIVQTVLLAATLTLLASGCTSTVTAGEVRRRELFQAMLAAWVLGLAFAWRWWGRPRRGA
jgi:hypothetical protein